MMFSVYFWARIIKTRKLKIESVLRIENTNILAQERTFYSTFLS